MFRSTSLSLLLASACSLAFAQDLPKEISGRWFWAARNVGQSFSLEDIQKTAGGFSARLTWWTMDGKCTVRGEPVTGQVNGNEIAFDAATKCNSFKARLVRDGDGWKGSATTTGAPAVTVEMTAK